MNRWHSPPPELYALVEHAPATVLLECAKHAATESHSEPPPDYPPDSLTRLFTAPLREVEANESVELPTLFAEIESAVAAGLFAAGFFTYECGNSFEPMAPMRPSRPGQPLAWFGIYDRPWLFDHRIGAFLNGDPPGLTQLRAGAADEESAPDPPLDASFGLTEPQYAERIAAIHEWIRAGDIYQLNFTVPLRVHAPGSPAALYRRLRDRQPVPYGAFLHWQPNRRILSFSPELFFRLEDHGPARRITTRPMKGTAPRGRTTCEDRALAVWLRNDPKNRAENVMIVDLLRNDLGRLCAFGSVRVENLFAVERYPTLWQMTSTVTGELRPEIGFHQIFRALFPCGSVTGAPKVRAMQLLAKIEEQPRGVYTGAIGFFSKEQTVFNVAIRTVELDGECGAMGVGSGIVIDSDPAGEFRECLLKAEFLTSASDRIPERFELLESLLWRLGYPFIELHLDRLEDSAHYFGFPCDRAEAKAALLAYAAAFGDRQPRKVRLLLNREGNLQIADELLSASTIPTGVQPVRACIASERTDPRDPMLFHKTTHRPLYAEALKAATQAGFDDVLFLNLRGEVTEGARHNIFVEKDGRLLTPPIECGLLAGVHRRHLLESQPNVEEKVLYLQDLRQADAVYLSNAVRGLRPAVIDWED
ncbi:MAG: aminodeoxychorismate synthase component I [Terracidiphilus sp.]|jgi:para-aminobenzoate synthetase/4-amino-4-deoxychorismate lyase